MFVAAILGAGPIGAAIAHRLSERSAFGTVRLIDEAAGVAAGKALDIRQSGPIGHFDTEVVSATDTLAAAGADVVVVADPVSGGGWEGDAGLGLLRTLVRAGGAAPFVMAGPNQTSILELAFSELKVPADRLMGSAPGAIVSAARALAGLEMQLSGSDVDLAVVGRPPRFVACWSAAGVSGGALTERIPAHRIAAISRGLARIWPPGPQAIAAVTARIADALVQGSRRLHHATTVLDGDLGLRGVAALLPVELGRGRVLRRVVPSLSPQERTELMNALAVGVTS